MIPFRLLSIAKARLRITQNTHRKHYGLVFSTSWTNCELQPFCLLLVCSVLHLSSQKQFIHRKKKLLGVLSQSWRTLPKRRIDSVGLLLSIFHPRVLVEVRFEMLEALGFQHWESLSNQACEVACVRFLCDGRWWGWGWGAGRLRRLSLLLVIPLGEQWGSFLKLEVGSTSPTHMYLSPPFGSVS